ncbi:hypothetical protein RIF25_12730 [Thermosynechococcaceae cyanobacterium BACA0444]|uniref:Uncharacterized protein n=1 Tax=Pseudocalidococcus azoricus BACA0444 TaxID=2918990 RepID=A0AAE4FVH4_9CYAN|nr:hypothetical protein [Pseudocalidococcus azoricus]MDS3861670.1 hypothetical protein [Pseudocalidococcus azoricus BACA0444]
MSNTAHRYLRLCQAYVQLADKFTQLDVEQMTLREKLIPFLLAFKHYKELSEQLANENTSLQAELEDIRQRYAQLNAAENQFAPELTSELEAALLEAEEQMALVEETIQEQNMDPDPDLLPVEKLLLDEYVTGTGELAGMFPEAGVNPKLAESHF